jgi:uncharacterized membrane protein YhaH (DUF805 family)
MHWMILPYKRMLDFQGRSARIEYWMFQLCVLLQLVAVVALIMALAPREDRAMPWASLPVLLLTVLAVVGGLAWLWAGLALTVRRFHDQDRSGWFVLLGAIPYVGGLISLVFMCMPGTVGPNRFGADPRNPHMSDVFA